MTNEQKAKEIAGYKPDEKPEIPMFQGQDGDKYACYESAMEMANWKDEQRRTPSDDTTEGFVHIIIGEVACHETELERQIEQGKAFAEHNKTVFDVAMAVAKSYDEQLQLRMDAYERERQSLAEIEKLKEYIKKVYAESSADIQRLDAENKKLKKELSRCRAANADYLTAKTEAENRVKLLKQEITDIKVPDSRSERHLRDELRKVRLECQQAWEHTNKEMAEDKELRERNKALKRKLDESNKQIEIHAKRERELESELDEYNDERNFI